MGKQAEGGHVGGRDWLAWHSPYDEPGSPLERRLRLVQGHVAGWLDERQGRPARIVSACAGQGRDVLEVLAGFPHRDALTVRLVELDERNVAAAQEQIGHAGLELVDVVCGNAGRTDAYIGAAPADLVLMCGVFGNISDDDVQRTIQHLPQLCAAGATVIWTRSRRAPDLTPTIRQWLDRAGLQELSFEAPADALFSVGVHRFIGTPQALMPGVQLFRFAQ